MDFDGVKNYVISRLNNELSAELTYHSVEHTLDVVASAERIAKMESVNGRDLSLIKTAALFHDIGFLETYDGHESLSVELAKKVLPEYGYDEKDIAAIESMIMSTRIPQTPKNRLDMILSDADLDYLGRDDLFLIGQRLQYEWKLIGKVTTIRDWHEKQLQFLKNHHYFTVSAKKLRENKKQENIIEIEKLLCIKK
ncbi:MAG: HD domain-containing protein [Bacteroidales bacterium]|nr:HD domain-containing protein [Bacteroidales bacterium]MCF8403344.1 HD domain-containing protein [Bacteroidales bacterium]